MSSSTTSSTTSSTSSTASSTSSTASSTASVTASSTAPLQPLREKVTIIPILTTATIRINDIFFISSPFKNFSFNKISLNPLSSPPNNIFY